MRFADEVLFEQFVDHIQQCFEAVWTGNPECCMEETFVFDAEKFPPTWLMEQFSKIDDEEFVVIVKGLDREDEDDSFAFRVRPDYDNSVFDAHYTEDCEQEWGLCVGIRPEVGR